MDEANGESQALLRVDGTEVTHTLSKTQIMQIGRALDCQIILNSPQDSSISRHHAEVRPLAESMSWEICDRGSENGTYVNGQQLSECHILQPGGSYAPVRPIPQAFSLGARSLGD